LRAIWPDVEIHLRADSGFAVPGMYEVCEHLRILYAFGLKINPLLERQSEALLAQAVVHYEQTGQPQCLFGAFWYQAGLWRYPWWTIIKFAVRTRLPSEIAAAFADLRFGQILGVSDAFHGTRQVLSESCHVTTLLGNAWKAQKLAELRRRVIIKTQ
jgi:hypothetical protein